jgi:DNA-binding transcriptional LysR family regulator
VLAGYRSTVDWPAATYWRDLVDAYPHARVILTVRGSGRHRAGGRRTGPRGPVRRTRRGTPPAARDRGPPVGTEQTLIGLATGHPLAARAYLDLADLADEDWALPPDPVGADHRGFRSACAAAGFTPRCRHRLGDATATADLVRASYAVSPFPPVAEPAGVALRPLRGNPLPRRHLLVWLRDGTSVSADDVHRELIHRFAAITPHPADPVRLTAVA